MPFLDGVDPRPTYTYFSSKSHLVPLQYESSKFRPGNVFEIMIFKRL